MASPNPKRIFMTGANGYVGSRITEFAIAEGYTVHGLTRSEAGATKLTGLGATPVRGDLHSLEVLKSESALADIVMHLADAFIGSGFTMPYDEVLRIDFAAVDAMVEGLKSSGKPKTLIVTAGSLLVEADPDGGETDESSPLATNLGMDRYKAEHHALALASENFKVICIRLAPFVYGQGGSGVKMFMQMAAGLGETVYVNKGSTRTTTVHVDDAARLYLLAAEKGRSGEAYNGTSETDLTIRQLVETMAEALSFPVKSLTYDEAVEKLGVFFAMFLTSENRASNAKAIDELGWQTKEVGILEDIIMGSYQVVAKELREAKSA